YDLQVMSLTSYRTAPPRAITFMGRPLFKLRFCQRFSQPLPKLAIFTFSIHVFEDLAATYSPTP
ncbi:uncharacterized protein METZ01_LOCUS391244, partial [marine metagenome]